MREYLFHTETLHHSVLCPPPYQTGVGILCLETTLGGIRGVTFPESAAVPVVLQPRPTWRGGAPRRVTDSVGDVLGDVIAQVSLALSYPEPFRVTGPLPSLVLRAEDMWQKHNQCHRSWQGS